MAMHCMKKSQTIGFTNEKLKYLITLNLPLGFQKDSIRAVPEKKTIGGGGEKILVGIVSRIQFFVRGVVQVVN